MVKAKLLVQSFTDTREAIHLNKLIQDAKSVLDRLGVVIESIPETFIEETPDPAKYEEILKEYAKMLSTYQRYSEKFLTMSFRMLSKQKDT
jgi:hypothetical protein